MSDQTSYLVATDGEPYAVSEYLQEVPALIVEVTPFELSKSGALKYKYEVYFQLKSDGLRRSGIVAMLRFDKSAAEKWECETSSDRRSAFFPHSKKPLERIGSATNLLVRFQTTLGHERTLRFNVSGLKDKLRELKARVVADRPSSVKFGTP